MLKATHSTQMRHIIGKVAVILAHRFPLLLKGTCPVSDTHQSLECIYNLSAITA